MSEKNKEIINVLRDRIIRYEYEPGVILNEQELADEFNVSRSPIRAALQQLERDGLIEIVARYGAQVKSIDFRSMGDLFELTRVLDPFVARLASSRITDNQIKELEEIMKVINTLKTNKEYQEAINYDEKFHRIVFDAAGNKWAEETIGRLHFHTERLWHYCKEYFQDMEIFSRTLNKILEALKERNGDLAEKYAREHIDDFVSKIKESLFKS